MNKDIHENQIKEVKILSVETRPGKDYCSFWKANMFQIKTDCGTFISATIPKHQEDWQNGQFVDWFNQIDKTLMVQITPCTQAPGWNWIITT